MRCTILVAALTLALKVTGDQLVLNDHDSSLAAKKRPLKGRFIHITDIHPDPRYKHGSTIQSGCHEKPEKDHKGKGKDKDGKSLDGEEMGVEDVKKKGEALAGRWGTGVSDCDSPMSLVNMTFDWLKKEWADEIDFVVWTGDNARHDIDRLHPRGYNEVLELNRMMIAKMAETFPKEVVVVPSIGNNDIYPHNVIRPGPNDMTQHYLHVWKHLIPENSRHIFERGAYFSVEVIPDRLAVISLNTLFWYDANTAVDGCRDRSRDPGALQIDWLEVQLQGYRERGMQVWMSGHVPPHMGHYYDTCYLRYGDLALRYQDTIVGHLFGHMNVDHFFFIDVDELEATSKLQSQTSSSSLNTSLLHQPTSFVGPPNINGPHLRGSGRYKTKGRNSNNGLQGELRKDFGDMPGPGKIKLKDYAVMNVAPSVIPTYLPGIRVFSYNISSLDDPAYFSDLMKKRKGGHRHHLPKDDCTRPENEDKPHCTFRHLPRHYDKNSPSRKNGPLTPLGYTQFYLPGVDSEGVEVPEWEIEYSTFKGERMVWNETQEEGGQPGPVPMRFLPGWKEFVQGDGGEGGGGVDIEEGDGVASDDGKGKGDGDGSKEKEKERERKRKEKFEEGIKRISPWGMKDLTVGSWVRLARKLVVKKKMWNKFEEFMFVSSDGKK